MQRLNLFLRQIADEYVQENFYRLLSYFQDQPLLNAELKFFEVDVPAATTSFSLAHGLSFVPRDVILLSAIGDNRFYFRYQEFTKTNLFITTLGPVRIRFLAGNYSSPGNTGNAINYPFVAPTP